MSVRVDRVKLIAEMARRDMTVNRLVELSGLSRVTVTGIRSGKSCSRVSANKLAAGLGVKLKDIAESEV